MRFGNSRDKLLKYNKMQLLEAMRKNRDTHLEDFQLAKQEYKKQSIKLLQDKLNAIESSDNLVVCKVDLPKPQCWADDYDRAIQAFDMTTETEIELTSQEFCQLVRDEWDWKDDFNRITASYANSAKGIPGATFE